MKRHASEEVAEIMAAADSVEIAEGLEFQQMIMPTNIEILSSRLARDRRQQSSLELRS